MTRRICLISREYPPDTAYGGIARAVHMEAQALAAAGVEVHVISLAPDGAERIERDGDVNVHRLAEPACALPGGMEHARLGLWSQAVAARYAALDWELGFDAVEAPDYRAEALHLWRRPETPLLVWLHTGMGLVWELSPEPWTGDQRAWDALERAAVAQADLVLAPTALVLERTRRRVGPSMPPARTLPHPFDASAFPARPGPRRDGGPVRALFVGRLEPRKGPDLALRAVADARRAGADVELRLVGRDDDGLRSGLDALAGELGLAGAVSYTPQVDAGGVVAELHAADCALLPSRFDNFHFAAVEALCCGVPVITTDRTGIATWFGPRDGLWALDADDGGAFATHAATVLADREALAAAGPQAARRARELFDRDALTERLLACHELAGALARGDGAAVAS